MQPRPRRRGAVAQNKRMTCPLWIPAARPCNCIAAADARAARRRQHSPTRQAPPTLSHPLTHARPHSATTQRDHTAHTRTAPALTPGIVRDKLDLYQMANLGVRVCWWALMTWMVVLMIGNGIFGVYISNIKYMITETLKNIDTLGPYVRGPYPDCPANCLDLWVVDYIKTSSEFGCICNRSTLQGVSPGQLCCPTCACV
jgi:hypothetical protein